MVGPFEWSEWSYSIILHGHARITKERRESALIVGLGTDIVDVRRIHCACERYGRKFLERVLSPGERAQCASVSSLRLAEFVAGRFAAKEAIAKAAGCGIGRLRMSEVELLVGDAGLEVRFLYTGRQPHWTAGRWHVSISHTEQMAFAVAIRELDTPRTDE
jgi:holo-[acyl-carrier protein] synthase